MQVSKLLHWDLNPGSLAQDCIFLVLCSMPFITRMIITHLTQCLTHSTKLINYSSFPIGKYDESQEHKVFGVQVWGEVSWDCSTNRLAGSLRLQSHAKELGLYHKVKKEQWGIFR